MADYWVANLEGKILGPVSFTVLTDLAAAGRLRNISRASKDGKIWLPVYEVVELSELFASNEQKEQARREKGEADRLNELVNRLTGKTLHEALGLPQGASLESQQAAFFSLVRRLYSGQLPVGASPPLRHAHARGFLLLSELMPRIAAPVGSAAMVPRPAPVAPRPMPAGPPVLARPAPVAAPAVTRAAVPPAAAAPSAAAAKQVEPVWERRQDDRINVRMQVSLLSAGIFTACKLVNISNNGMFIAHTTLLPLGQRVDVTLDFEDLQREITVSAFVVRLNESDTPQLPKGVGLKLHGLTDDQKRFLQWFVKRAEFLNKQAKR